MTEPSQWRRRRGYRETIIGAISAGFFLILVGIIFIMTPGLFSRILEFIQGGPEGFGILQIPNTGVYFFAPNNPFMAGHITVYRAVQLFSLVWGIFQIVILIIRVAVRSTLGRIAETASNIGFSLGATYLIGIFLVDRTWLTSSLPLTVWFAFWAAIIMLAGVTTIIRGVILAAGLAARRAI